MVRICLSVEKLFEGADEGHRLAMSPIALINQMFAYNCFQCFDAFGWVTGRASGL